MNTDLEKNTKIYCNPVTVAPSKIFTYPTRLAEAWKADILEINLSTYQLRGHEFEITIRQDSSRSLGYKNRNFYKEIYRKFAPQNLMDEEYIYDTRYETDRNMAHILCNVAFRLLMFRETIPNITVILRANASTMAREVYRLLRFPILCTDRDVYGKLITTIDLLEGNCEGLQSSLYADLNFEGFDHQTPDRVFISRKGMRCLVNENEVEQTLRKYGFEKIYFEDIPISKQWSIARNAKVVVALHGAALSSLVFNCNMVKVVELFHPGYVVNMYRHLTNAIGGMWCGVTGQMPENIIRELDYKQKARSFALSPTRIDITSLQMALQHLDIQSFSGK